MIMLSLHNFPNGPPREKKKLYNRQTIKKKKQKNYMDELRIHIYIIIYIYHESQITNQVYQV